MKGYRRIVVDGHVFRYKVGSTCTVIRDQDRLLRATPYHEELTEMTAEEIDRACQKKYFSITPAQVEEFIRKHLLEEKK